MKISPVHSLSLGMLLPPLLLCSKILAAPLAKFDSGRYLALLSKEEIKAVHNWVDSLNSLSSKTLTKMDAIGTKEERLFDPSEIVTTFPGACLILTGETEKFDFERLPEVPYMLSVGVASAKRLKNSASRLTTSFAKTVRQQLVIHTDAILSYTRMDTPQLKLFPLTVVVVNTKLPYMTDAFPPVLNIIEAFSATGDALVYCLSFDLQSHKMVDGRLHCPFCDQRKESTSSAGVSRNLQWNSQLKYGKGTAQDQIMHDLRNSAIFDGIRLKWSTNHAFPASSLISLGQQWSRSVNTPEKYFNAQVGLDSIIFQTLFPTLNRTSFPKGTATAYYCTIYSSSSLLHCRTHFLTSTSTRPALTISLNQERLRDKDIIFISSEKTKEADGVTAADLFLKVVTFQVWMALLFSLLATATICILCDIVSRDRDYNKVLPTMESIFQAMKRLTGAGLYLLVGFLGQYNGSLPVEGSRSIHLIRWLMSPWLISHLLIPIWYTSYLQISFSFTYPYKLEMQSWEGFENYSVYFLESDARIDPSGVTAPYFLPLSQTSYLARVLDFLYWDMNNFNDSVEWPAAIKIFEEGIGFRMVHSRVTKNPWYRSSHAKGDVLQYIFKSEDGIQQPEDFPVLVWFKDTLQSLELCIARNRSCNHLFDDKSSSQCLKEKFIMWKMMLRHDHTVPSKLGLYVGQRYRDKISMARRQGLQIKMHMDKFEKEWEDAISKKTMLVHCLFSPGSGPFSRDECKSDLLQEHEKWEKMRRNITKTLYWMVKRPEAVFVVSRNEFRWYWPLFQKIMRENLSLKFAHTGPIALRQDRHDKGLGGNGFESQVQIQGPLVSYLPEVNQMIWRIRALTHSGILGLYAKWNMILQPPLNKTEVRAVEEVATEASALKMENEIMGYTFGILVVGTVIISATAFSIEATIGQFKSENMLVGYHCNF